LFRRQGRRTQLSSRTAGRRTETLTARPREAQWDHSRNTRRARSHDPGKNIRRDEYGNQQELRWSMGLKPPG